MEELQPNIKLLLSDYLESFSRLRSPAEYPGSHALIKDYKNLKNGEWDGFFEKYGVGNDIFSPNQPFERASAYEQLLYILREYDPRHYQLIHKGTPYYFIGWTAYQFQDFEKALFYMDAAVSEDLRFPEIKTQKKTTPAIDFFLLTTKTPATGFLLHIQLNGVISNVIREFNSRSSLKLQISDFIDKFVKKLLYEGKENRSVIAAIYGFFLEFEKRKMEISLKSSEGGSIEPFINHLFSGARLLESLLEVAGGSGQTLRLKIRSLPQLEVAQSCLLSDKTLTDAETTFAEMTSNGDPFQECNFASSYIIRNTTGHSLIWPDQFTNNNSYTTLYNCLVNSILWSIYKLYNLEG